MATEAVIERMIVELIGNGQSYQQMLKEARIMTTQYTNQINNTWYNATGQFITAQERMQAQMFQTRNAAIRSAAAMKALGEEVMRAGRSMSLYITAPLVLIGRAAIKAGSDFESGFAGIRKTVDATEMEFKRLNREFRELAATIPVSAEELLRIGEISGQLGVQTGKISDFTRTIAELSVTTNLSAEEGATSLARFANIVQMSQDKFQNLGSAVVALGNKLPATEHEIMEMSMRIAGAGHTVGLAASDVLALAASLTSVGIKSEMGGSAISRMMLQVTRDIATGSETIERFASISGMSTEQFKESWRRNVGETILTFLTGLKALGPEASALALEELELDGIRLHQTMLGSANAVQLFADAMNISSTAFRENTALTEEAEKRFATFSSQVSILYNKIKLLFTEMFEVARPTLLEVGKNISDIIAVMRGWSDETKGMILAFGAAVAALGPFLLISGSIIASIGQLRLAFILIKPALFAVFGVPGIGQILGLVALLVTALVNWDETMETLGYTMGPFKELLMSLGDLFNNLMVALGPLIKLIGETLVFALNVAIGAIHVIIYVLKNMLDMVTKGLTALIKYPEFAAFLQYHGMAPKSESGGVKAPKLPEVPTQVTRRVTPVVPKFDILTPEQEAWHKEFGKATDKVQDMKAEFDEEIMKLQMSERDYLISQLMREQDKGVDADLLYEVLQGYDKLQAAKKEAAAVEKQNQITESINAEIRALVRQRAELQMSERAFFAWDLARKGASEIQIGHALKIYDEIKALEEMEEQKEKIKKKNEEAAKAEEKFRDSIQMTVEATGGGLSAMVAREEARRRRAVPMEPKTEEEKKKAQEEKLTQYYERMLERQAELNKIMKNVEKNTSEFSKGNTTVIKPANIGG